MLYELWDFVHAEIRVALETIFTIILISFKQHTVSLAEDIVEVQSIKSSPLFYLWLSFGHFTQHAFTFPICSTELTGPTFILPPPPQHPATFFNSIDAGKYSSIANCFVHCFGQKCQLSVMSYHCSYHFTKHAFTFPICSTELTTVTALPVAPPLFRSSHAGKYIIQCTTVDSPHPSPSPNASCFVHCGMRCS